MDIDSFKEEMDYDTDIIKMILKEFLSSIESQIPLMKELKLKKDYSRLNREAHSIKGGSRNIMAQGLEITSTALEHISLTKDDVKIDNAIIEFEKEYKRFGSFAKDQMLV